MPFLNKNQFLAPIQQSISSSIEKAATGTINALTQSITSNQLLAGPAQLVGELAGRVGINIPFSNLTKNIGLNVLGDKLAAIDKTTNLPITEIANVPSQVIPSNSGDKEFENATASFRVILEAKPGGAFTAGGSGDRVIFTVMPRISESRSTEYEPFSPLHHPGQIQKYKSTSSRSWKISARLVSRNSQEASINMYYMNIIRAWAMPFYGQGTANNKTTSKLLGAPPPIITLSAYGDDNIGPVKTVMTSYGWDFPNDIDYIKTLDGKPFPVILEVSLDLLETWSPAEFSAFDINAYREGKMADAFKLTSGSAPAEPTISVASTATSTAEPTTSSTSSLPIATFKMDESKSVLNAFKATAQSAVGTTIQSATQEAKRLVGEATTTGGKVVKSLVDQITI